MRASDFTDASEGFFELVFAGFLSNEIQSKDYSYMSNYMNNACTGIAIEGTKSGRTPDEIRQDAVVYICKKYQVSQE